MTLLSTKPYLIRAIHEWCLDQGFTPYLQVTVDNTPARALYKRLGFSERYQYWYRGHSYSPLP